MKKAKREFSETDTSYYFIGYSDKEITEYILNNPPKTVQTSPFSWSTNYTICKFEYESEWTRFWKVLEMIKQTQNHPN